jgi:hypothetical protein
MLLFFGLLTLIATINLLRYDYNEKKWYDGKIIIQKQHQLDTITKVCILATVHQENSNYNADSIVAILNLVQPDLILTEEDTLLFKTTHGEYKQNIQKPLFARLGRSFGFGTAPENEGRAVRKYKIANSSVDISPYDYEGRNAFYQKNNTFSKEEEINNRIVSLANNHSLNDDQAKIWKSYGNINDMLNKLNNQSPYFINQPDYDKIAEKRQAYQYQKVAEIVNTNDSLKEYRNFYKTNADFWDIRNKVMSGHISSFIRKYSKKRILVLTGAMHKYYLLKELTPLQDELKFKLIEYYE